MSQPQKTTKTVLKTLFPCEQEELTCTIDIRESVTVASLRDNSTDLAVCSAECGVSGHPNSHCQDGHCRLVVSDEQRVQLPQIQTPNTLESNTPVRVRPSSGSVTSEQSRTLSKGDFGGVDASTGSAELQAASYAFPHCVLCTPGEDATADTSCSAETCRSPSQPDPAQERPANEIHTSLARHIGREGDEKRLRYTSYVDGLVKELQEDKLEMQHTKVRTKKLLEEVANHQKTITQQQKDIESNRVIIQQQQKDLDNNITSIRSHREEVMDLEVQIKGKSEEWAKCHAQVTEIKAKLKANLKEVESQRKTEVQRLQAQLRELEK